MARLNLILDFSAWTNFMRTNADIRTLYPHPTVAELNVVLKQYNGVHKPGTRNIIFETEEDALAFKLKYG